MTLRHCLGGILVLAVFSIGWAGLPGGPVAAADRLSSAFGNTTFAPAALQADPPRITRIASASTLRNVLTIRRMVPNVGDSEFYSVDGGASWLPLQSPPSSNLEVGTSIVRREDRNQPTRLVAPYNDQFWRSGDFGASWAVFQFPLLPTCAATPQSGGSINTLVTSPADPRRVYVTYACEDPTNWTFSRPTQTAGDQALASQYHDEAMYFSSDAGQTWQKLPAKSLSLWPSPVLPNRLYAPGLAATPPDTGVSWFVSDDSGASWTTKTFPVSRNDFFTLDGVSPNILYGVVFSEVYPPYPAPDGALAWHSLGYRSIDEGSTWTTWESPCPDLDLWQANPVQLIAHPTHERVLYMTCGAEGLWRSQDGGDTWVKLASNKGQFFAPDYGNPGRLLWALDGELLQSCDDGDTWSQIDAVCAYGAFRVFLPALRR